MALFDFEIVYSGIASIPTAPDIEVGITVYSRFVNLYNELHEISMYLNPDIMSSGFNAIQVGGTAIGGSLEQYIGLVVNQRNQRRIIVYANSREFICNTRPDERFEIDDTVLVYAHISHRSGRFGSPVWNATKKMLTRPGILSMIVDLQGAGGSGIGRINVDPYSGEIHYGSGLES